MGTGGRAFSVVAPMMELMLDQRSAPPWGLSSRVKTFFTPFSFRGVCVVCARIWGGVCYSLWLFLVILQCFQVPWFLLFLMLLLPALYSLF